MEEKIIIGKDQLTAAKTFSLPETLDKSYIWDKLDEIMSDQKVFDEEVNEQYKDQNFNCYNFRKNNFDVWYPLMRAQSEINEAADHVPSKTWKYSDNTELTKEQKYEILVEIIDAQKFLNKAIIQLGFNAQDVYETHMQKSITNRNRQEGKKY